MTENPPAKEVLGHWAIDGLPARDHTPTAEDYALNFNFIVSSYSITPEYAKVEVDR